MGAMMAMIFVALVFYTLYEQTYGSWVTFTDRLLTKDLFPSLVIRDGTPWPWSIVALLLAPLAFVVASSLSDRNPASPCAAAAVLVAVLAMLVALLRDALVLPQTAGSLTYLGSMFIVLLAPLFAVLWAWLDQPRAGSVQADEIGVRPAVRRPELPAAGLGRAACRRHRRAWRACGGWCWPTCCWSSARCACIRSACRP